MLVFPLKSTIYLTLGKTYLNINFYSKAIEIFKKGIEIDPEDIILINNFGSAYFQNKEYTNAELTLEASLRIDPDNLNSLISYGRILSKNKKFEDSSIYFIEALNKINQNLKNLTLILPKVKFPLKDNVIPINNYNSLKDIKKIFGEFSKIKGTKIQISYELGLALLNIGEFDKAEDLAKESLGVIENVSAYFLLSLFNFHLENYQESIDACVKALDIDKNQKSIRAWLIYLYFESGDTQKAFEIANLILKNEPEDELIWNELGYIYSKTGEYQRATEVLNRAIQINYKLASPWAHLGYIEYKKGNNEMALKYIKKAMKKNPDYPRALYYLAKVLFSQGKADEALVNCNKCLKIDPNFKDAYILRDALNKVT
jgi:tetratricopeptide (TPR) repeat protein